MRYLSVCSGIEAASVAWAPLGWEAAAFAEIDAFPSAVLRYRWPSTPNLGDFTRIEAADVGPIDVLIGGTPCQSFSVAGRRGGLGDGRGGLALEFLELAGRARPRWLAWENVPGVLSTRLGRDFGAIIGKMVELGYGVAWRVLDAQHWGLAQRRKRLFVIGYLGDWRPAAAVLFERESLRGNSPPRRQAGKAIAGTLGARAAAGGGLGSDFECGGGLLAHALRSGGFDADEDGTGRGAPLVPAAYGGNDTSGPIRVAAALNAKGGSGRSDFESETLIAFNAREDPDVSGGVAGSLSSSSPQAQAVAFGGGGARALDGVRRLTPRECERLMGFPDDYTAIPWRGKPAGQCPDGPRYRALGNSMATPVIRWIGERIDAVDAARRAHSTEAASAAKAGNGARR